METKCFGQIREKMTQKKLISVNGRTLSLGFNLRQPRANKCTQVYAVVRLGGGRHIKFPLGKLNTWEWDAKREIPIFRERMNSKDGVNAMNVLQRISAFRLGYYDFYLYLCGVGELRMTSDEIREELNNRTTATHTHFFLSKLFLDSKQPILAAETNTNNQIITNMTKNTEGLGLRGGSKRATTIIKKAFADYQRQRTLSDGTLRAYKQYVTVFSEYAKEHGNSIKRLSQEGIEEYQQYLMQKGDTNNTVNRKTELIVRLVNNGILNKAKLGLKNISIARLKVKEKDSEEKVRRPLTDEEVRRLEQCRGLKPSIRESADLFLLQIYCGCRNSDIHRLFDPTKHKMTEQDGVKLMTIKTKKSQEKLKAQIIVTPQIESILNRYSGGFKYVNFASSGFEKKHNEHIKKFAKASGLDSIEHFIEDGKQVTAPLYEKIAGHFGRYTLVHQRLREGYTPEEVALMVGHKDGTQVREIYGVLDDQEHTEKTFKVIKKVMGQKATEETKAVGLGETKEFQDVLRFFGCPYTDFKDLTTSEDLVRLIVSRYEIPLTTEYDYTIDRLKEVYNSKDWQEQDRILRVLGKIRERMDK